MESGTPAFTQRRAILPVLGGISGRYKAISKGSLLLFLFFQRLL
ncbi:hypothetical protein LEP1GSC202_1961 [Leptospira yanagawae serovar Saopaulo str. Sao Paulo = ATCC 700523]|uniref:Uncharacterized protein n=1 Tax=Leptospira yanagawae serovar Saopaulo str. Sao Paulo = ATCC 700523 TaxID=1249483 RepID=A0A5E8HEG9_9LEPT|nr:hypothetical protein LEP1GSC202_1961 [Leptospira yanagawae serovar Saopaulo str. Sao Paulo = ATCC 700523]